MELQGLIVVLVLYTLVVAAVVAVFLRLVGFGRRQPVGEVPVSSRRGSTVDPLRKREPSAKPMLHDTPTNADVPPMSSKIEQSAALERDMLADDSAALLQQGIERDLKAAAIILTPELRKRSGVGPVTTTSSAAPEHKIARQSVGAETSSVPAGMAAATLNPAAEQRETPESHESERIGHVVVSGTSVAEIDADTSTVEVSSLDNRNVNKSNVSTSNYHVSDVKISNVDTSSTEASIVDTSNAKWERADAINLDTSSIGMLDDKATISETLDSETLDADAPDSNSSNARTISIIDVRKRDDVDEAEILEATVVHAGPAAVTLREIDTMNKIDAANLALMKDASMLDSLRPVFGDGAVLPEGLRTLEVTPNRIIEPGMTVRATFTLRNLGGGIASGFRVRFRLPEGLLYARASARIGDTPLEEQNAETPLLQPLGAEIGDVPAGGERRVSLAFTVADTIENGTPVQLQVAVASPDVPVIGSNVVRLSVRSRPVLQNPMTTLTLVAIRAALPGEELQLTARVHNSGQSSALDLIVLLPVPANTSFAPETVTIDGLPFTSALPRAMFGFSRPTIVTPALVPGATVVIGYRVRIDTPLEDATRIVAQGTVCSQEVSEFGLPSATLEIPSTADFNDEETSFRVDCADDVEPGERLRIALRTKNVGTATARDFSLAIVLSDGMTYAAGSLTLDNVLAPDHGSGPGVIRLGDLGPGRVVDLALIAIVQSPAPNGLILRASGRVGWSKGERSFGRDLAVRSAPRFPAEFNRIERDSAQRVGPGEPVAYTIALANMGTDRANDVRVKLTADPGLDALTVRNGDLVIPLGDDLSVPLEALEPGVSLLLRVTGRVAGIVEDQKQLRLQAELQTEQIRSIVLGSQIHVIESRPTFTVKTSRIIVDSTQALRFKRVNQCRLLLVNEGTDRGRDVRVTLLLPDELRLEGVDNATREGDAIVFGDIPAGEQREAIVYVRLVGIVTSGEPLSIAARIGGANVVPVGLKPIQLTTHAEASFAEDATLLSAPDKTVDAGAEIEYTLTLRNGGDGAAKHLAARLAFLNNAVYAQGSTTVNGIALQDHAGTSLLLSEGGLQLAQVGAGVEIVASWRAIVNMPLAPGTAIESAVSIRWDEAAELTVAAPALSVQSTSALPIIDPDLTFSVLGAIAARSTAR